jgi:hypothetical protein
LWKEWERGNASKAANATVPAGGPSQAIQEDPNCKPKSGPNGNHTIEWTPAGYASSAPAAPSDVEGETSANTSAISPVDEEPKKKVAKSPEAKVPQAPAALAHKSNSIQMILYQNFVGTEATGFK